MTIRGNTSLKNFVRVGEESFIDEGCSIGRNVTISSKVSISRFVELANDASISAKSTIVEGAYLSTCIFIQGSRHKINYGGNGKLVVGCKEFEIDHWLSYYRQIGRFNNYTPAQIEEYYGYITLIDRLYKDNPSWHIKPKLTDATGEQ